MPFVFMAAHLWITKSTSPAQVWSILLWVTRGERPGISGTLCLLHTQDIFSDCGKILFSLSMPQHVLPGPSTPESSPPVFPNQTFSELEDSPQSSIPLDTRKNGKGVSITEVSASSENGAVGWRKVDGDSSDSSDNGQIQESTCPGHWRIDGWTKSGSDYVITRLPFHSEKHTDPPHSPNHLLSPASAAPASYLSVPRAPKGPQLPPREAPSPFHKTPFWGPHLNFLNMEIKKVSFP